MIDVKDDYDALFTSDWHISSWTPTCRKDNYLATLKGKIRFVLETAVRYNVPIFIAGDIGDKPLWRGKLFAEILTLLNVLQTKPKIYAIAGQHDLPYHNIDKIKDSALWVLHCSGFLKILRRPAEFENFIVYPHHYGTFAGSEYPEFSYMAKKIKKSKKKRVALVHQLICKDRSTLAEKMKAFYAKDVLKGNPGFDLIVSGDNHTHFAIEVDKRKLLNCGALIRKDISLIDYVPLIYLWRAKENYIQSVIVPFVPDVWTKDANEFFDDKNDVSLFIKKLTSVEGMSYDFVHNLEQFVLKNIENIPEGTRVKLLKLIENKDAYE